MQTSIRRSIKLLSFSLVLWSGNSTSMRAQQRAEFWPEVDAHLTLNSSFRTYFRAKSERDKCNPLQVELGPSLQLYLKPSIKLKQVTAFDLDDAKPRSFVMESDIATLPRRTLRQQIGCWRLRPLTFPWVLGFTYQTVTAPISIGKTPPLPGAIETS